MSSLLPAKRSCPSLESSDELENEKNEQVIPPSNVARADTNGSLLRMLSPELLVLIFQWIGLYDLKSFVWLAICSDQDLAHFIYTECTFLWREIDLANCRGITDRQLNSLLERVNARSVTKSIILHKKATITALGLEPLQGSRVLQSIEYCNRSTCDKCLMSSVGGSILMICWLPRSFQPCYHMNSKWSRLQR